MGNGAHRVCRARIRLSRPAARGGRASKGLSFPMLKFLSRLASAATLAALFSAFAPAARAELLLVTYTSGFVGTEIFKFNTLDGSGVPGYGDSEISFPLLYDSQGNNNVTFAAPYVENSSYPGTTIITCCNTGFYDGVDPPIFTGGSLACISAPTEHSPSRLHPRPRRLPPGR